MNKTQAPPESCGRPDLDEGFTYYPSLDKRFTYHAPKTDQPERYVALGEKAKELAYMIVKLSPPTREQSLALTHLEETMFWANAGIARTE